MVTPENIMFLFGVLIGIALFYFIIRGAVKSGTSDILDELRKRS